MLRVGDWAYWTMETRAGDTLKIKVYITDARENFGRWDFAIRPVAGRGKTWVQEDKLESV